MQRILGAIAIFGAWISLPVSAIFGLVATDFMGLTLKEERLPSYGVFGIPEILILGMLGVAMILGTVPIGTIIFSARPGRWVYYAAAAMGVIGCALLLDDLGRAHAAAILPGAALLFVGARLIETTPETKATAPDPAVTAGVAASPDAAQPAAATVAPPVATPPIPDATPAVSGARPAARARRAGKPGSAVCPWCSAPIKPSQERCQSCGAALVETPQVAEESIPGLTTVSPELRDWVVKSAHKSKRPSLLSVFVGEPDDRLLPVDDRADPRVFARPNEAVLAAMAQLDREIALGQSAVTEPAPVVAEGAAGETPAESAPQPIDPAPAQTGRRRRATRTPKS